MHAFCQQQGWKKSLNLLLRVFRPGGTDTDDKHIWHKSFMGEWTAHYKLQIRWSNIAYSQTVECIFAFLSFLATEALYYNCFNGLIFDY